MRFSVSDFPLFLREAASSVPVMIIGGRVRASAVSATRKSGSGIVVLLDDYSNTCKWVSGAGFSGIEIAGTIAAALSTRPRPQIAIVASRPRDHVRDALEEFFEGLHVLVENRLPAKRQMSPV